MTPKEAYWEIKAAKAREDRHYGFLAQCVATLYNAHGPKKPLKREDVYKPHYPAKKSRRREETPEERRARQRDLKQHVESLIARYGKPVVPPQDNG